MTGKTIYSKKRKKRLSTLRVNLQEEIAKAKRLLPEFPDVSIESIRNAVHQIETLASPELLISSLENERLELLPMTKNRFSFLGDSAA